MALTALSGGQIMLFNPASGQKGYQAALSCLMSYLSSSAIRHPTQNNAAIRVGPQFGVHRSWGYEESNAGTWRYGAAAVIGPRPRSVTWRWPTLQTAGPSCFDCGWKGIRNVGSLRIRWGAHAGG